MKQILIITILCFNLLCVFSQKVSIKFSNNFSFENGYSHQLLNGIYYEQESNIKMLSLSFFPKQNRNKAATITIREYNIQKEASRSVVVENEKKVFSTFPTMLKVFANKLYLFYYTFSDTGDSIHLYMSDLNLKTLQIQSSFLLYSFVEKYTDINNPENIAKHNRLILQESYDSSKLYVCQSGNTNEVFVAMIDSNAKVINSNTTKLPDLNSFKATSFAVDKYENRYLCYQYNDVKGVVVNGYAVINTAGIIKLQDYNKHVSIDFFNDNFLMVKTSHTGDVVHIFGNDIKKDLSDGIFYGILDANSCTIRNLKNCPYSNEIKEKLYKNGYGYRNKSEISVLAVPFKVQELSDGKFILYGSAQKFIEGRQAPISSNAISIPSHLYIGPIILFMISEESSVSSIIPREQYSTPSSDVIMMPYNNDKFAVFYCDNEINISRTINDKIASGIFASKLDLIMAIVNTNGVVESKKKVIQNPVDRGYYRMGSYIPENNNSLIIPIGIIKSNSWNGFKTYYELVKLLDLRLE